MRVRATPKNRGHPCLAHDHDRPARRKGRARMSGRSATRADDAAVRTRTGAILLARYAFAAAPSHEMARLTARIASLPAIHRAVFAYAEQGHPTLRDALLDIRDGCDRVLILPLIVPMEPSFR